MTPEQLAELFVEDTGDNITGIATDIEILLKQAYKSGYKCAVDKTEEWLDENLFTREDCFGDFTATSVNSNTQEEFIKQYLKEIEL